MLALNKLGDNNQVLILDGSQHIAAIWVIKMQTLLPKEELIYIDAQAADSQGYLTVGTLLKWGLHQDFLEIDVLVVSDREE